MPRRIVLLSLISILFVSSVLRLWDLGYSNFYGDETKTLFVRKDVSAKEFMLTQRKGPVQFLAVWGMEKLVGYNSEFYARLPFAIAGILSVLAVFLLVNKMFGSLTALFSSAFYSFSGMNVAFSRTAQYQTVLLFFGLMSIYLLLSALKNDKPWQYLVSGVFLGIAFLAHYDAIYFLIPCILILVVHKKEYKPSRLVWFLSPLIALPALFYVPYFFQGYFARNALGYLTRRFDGSEQLPSSNFWTIFVYNPSLLYFVPLLLGVVAFAGNLRTYFKPMLFWFLVPFICLSIFVVNPGTHIQTYLLPLYLLSGVTVASLYHILELQGFGIASKALLAASGVVVLGSLCFTSAVFLPKVNKGYPWKKDAAVLGMVTNVPRDKYQFFLYGFPYNRGWNQIRDYFLHQRRVEGFYTNDNEVTAKYYLREYASTPPGPNFYPQYYIEVYDNLNAADRNDFMLTAFSQEMYQKVETINLGGNTVAIVYKIIQVPKVSTN